MPNLELVTEDTKKQIRETQRFLGDEEEDFIDNLLLNVILRELVPESRRKLYSLIEGKNFQDAKLFILGSIPDFNNKLLARAKEILS